MMKILTLGDSNASNLWGDAWPVHLEKHLNCEVINFASPGAGNGMFIDKLNGGVQEHHPDYVVIQLTEMHRLTLGERANEGKDKDQSCFNGVGYYTWNVRNNAQYIFNNTGIKTNADDYMIKNVLLSKWIENNFFQDILKMQYICDSFSVPCIFYSWFDCIDEVIIQDYKWLLEKITYIKGTAKEWFETNQIQKEDDHVHYGTYAHEQFVVNWLIPNLLQTKVLTNK